MRWGPTIVDLVRACTNHLAPDRCRLIWVAVQEAIDGVLGSITLETCSTAAGTKSSLRPLV